MGAAPQHGRGAESRRALHVRWGVDSVENPNVSMAMYKATTLADLLVFFSPDLGTYLNMSLNSSIVYEKMGWGTEGS